MQHEMLYSPIIFTALNIEMFIGLFRYMNKYVITR